MTEIPTSEVLLGDIGCRVVAIDETGNAYAGTLTAISAMAWKYGERKEDKVRIRLEISSTEGSNLKLDALPLDFRLQIERGHGHD